MALRIEQDYRYRGDHYWNWRIWIVGPEKELDQIDHVVYTLHPTFPNPVRTTADRASNFRLETAGWGTFRIYAKAVLKDGSENHLEHDLELRYPDDTPAPA